MNNKTLLTAIGLIFIGIIIGIVGITGLQMTDNVSAQQPRELVALGNSTYTPKESMLTMKAINQAFIDVASVAKPAVVSIDVETTAKPLLNKQNTPDGEDPNDMFHFFFRQQPRGNVPMRGSGSGVIISPDGYVITNHHVVREGGAAANIKVILEDRREFKAKFIGSDPLTDIAVVKIDAKDLPVMSFGDSDGVQVGEWVIAVGNPFQLASTVTAGIVSALSRNIDIIGDSYGVENFIQTDAAVNPGNSGGALVNIEGKLIGINTAIATRTGSYAGYSFAVPINLAKAVAEDLIKYGKVTRGYIGVQIKRPDATEAKALGLARPEGAWVQSLVPDGAAKQAGIEPNDVIIAVDGKAVRAPNDLQAYVARKHPNDKVVVKVLRDGKEKEITVTLKARAEKQDVAESKEPDAEPDMQLGLEVKDLTDADKKKYDVEYGVRVSSIDIGGQAAARGINKEDVIMEVNRQRVNSVKEFKSAISSIKAGEAALLRIRKRDKSTQFVAIEVASK